MSKKPPSKKPAKAVAKKSPKLCVVAEKRPNKHRAYLKIQKDDETGANSAAGVGGKDSFFMGTFDDDLITHIVGQIEGLCSTQNSSDKMKVIKTNASLAALLEIDPQDSTEMMLATQMVTAHNVAMEMARRAMLVNDQTDEVVNFNVNRMTKLMRTYTSQMEALNKYRNKGKQQITVKHQHVNVNDGGQAVIGDVNQGEGNG